MTTIETFKLAVTLMDRHGLIQRGWKPSITYAHNHDFGKCIYSTRTIEINRLYAEAAPIEGVTDTILHEIAHALTPGAGHGPVQYVSEKDESIVNLAAASKQQRFAQMKKTMEGDR